MNQKLLSTDFSNTKDESCIWIKILPNRLHIFLLYQFDDFLVSAKSSNITEEQFAHMNKKSKRPLKHMNIVH